MGKVCGLESGGFLVTVIAFCNELFYFYGITSVFLWYVYIFPRSSLIPAVIGRDYFAFYSSTWKLVKLTSMGDISLISPSLSNSLEELGIGGCSSLSVFIFSLKSKFSSF
jgi:hypothetical protein